MERTCDGRDPYLLDKDGEPCTCGQTFDDVRYGTIWPHQYIPTRRERVYALIENWPVVKLGLTEAYPGTDWNQWLVELATEAGLYPALPEALKRLGVALNDAKAGEEVKVRMDGPVFHGGVRGAQIAWGNGSVVQNGDDRG